MAHRFTGRTAKLRSSTGYVSARHAEIEVFCRDGEKWVQVRFHAKPDSPPFNGFVMPVREWLHYAYTVLEAIQNH